MRVDLPVISMNSLATCQPCSAATETCVPLAISSLCAAFRRCSVFGVMLLVSFMPSLIAASMAIRGMITASIWDLMFSLASVDTFELWNRKRML